MSSDAEPNVEEVKVEEKKVENDVSKDSEKDEKKEETEEEEKEVEAEKPTAKKPAAKTKEAAKKKEAKSEEEEEDEEEEESDKEEDGKEEKPVPLLDQPLKQSGPRQRKGVERFEPKEGDPVDIPSGRGVSLGSISVIEYNIHKIKGDELKKLHHLLFGQSAKANFIKRNLRKFNGFEFAADSDEYQDKKAELAKLNVKSVAELLALPVAGGSKEELLDRVMGFLTEPAAGSHGNKPAAAVKATKSAPTLTRGGRPRRTAAARVSAKGFSDSEEEDSDVQRPPRSRRAKGKRVNLKDDSSSNEEEAAGSDKETSAEETPPLSSAEDSDDAPSRKKRPAVKAAPKKAPARKSAPARKAAPAKGGKGGKKPPAAAEKKAPAKRAVVATADDDDSSNDDAPLVKKAKAPPTEAEIKAFVKEILQGANLEEITMKTVCKQVYARFPEFDLAHKKDFIKATVKSLIST